VEVEAACIVRKVSNSVQAFTISALRLTVVTRSSLVEFFIICPKQIASNSYPEETSNVNIWLGTVIHMYQRCNSLVYTQAAVRNQLFSSWKGNMIVRMSTLC